MGLGFGSFKDPKIQKADKRKHVIRISLPYWASLSGGLYGISLSLFLLMCFFGGLILHGCVSA